MPSQPEGPHERPIILVVESERGLLRFLVTTLRDQYQVLVANNGLEALEILAAVGSVVAAIVADVWMPRMGGLALATTLRERGTAVPLLFVTRLAGGASIPGPFLEAPFTAAQLLDAVGRLHTPRARPTLLPRLHLL